MPGTELNLKISASQRMTMLGRLRMAEWIEMPEREFATEIEKIEKNPLFRKLLGTVGQDQGIIRRQRWPSSRINGSFYGLNEAVVSKGDSVQVEESLNRRRGIVSLIRKMGREAFERYFLYGEEALGLEEIARRSGLKFEEAEKVHDLLLEIGSQQEFASPGAEKTPSKSNSCLARISLESGESIFEFFSPYWARGLYRVRYELLEDWKTKGVLSAEDRRRLPRLMKRIETVNLRQSTMFRILESLTKLQTEYLKSKREDRKFPISLRQLARRLDLAPSTVSRALSGRSVQLPWGKEAALSELVPGRRFVVREILSRWSEAGLCESDAALAERLRKEYGIRLARRTVNAVRNEISSGH